MKEEKMQYTGHELSRDHGLPDEFGEYIDYTRSLGFRVEPDYAYLRRLLRRRFKAEGFKNDNVFDWTIKRFNELQDDGDGGGDETGTTS